MMAWDLCKLEWNAGEKKVSLIEFTTKFDCNLLRKDH